MFAGLATGRECVVGRCDTVESLVGAGDGDVLATGDIDRRGVAVFSGDVVPDNIGMSDPRSPISVTHQIDGAAPIADIRVRPGNGVAENVGIVACLLVFDGVPTRVADVI